ncbi:RidA family protein [Embleya sp. NPDC005971]|uniref:RidA family protein n=1 Tax=Embleya sp. NPDC005971 TaxID=3156724 RepID=UPI0033F7FC27
MTIIKKLAELGYDFEPADLEFPPFQQARRVGDLVFTSGQISTHDGLEIKGKVGKDVDIERAAKGAELAAYNCLRAVGAVADIESIQGIVKVLGMVNVAEGFDSTPLVIDGASEFLRKALGDRSRHARSAVGMVLPYNWAVEIEMVVHVA